VTHAGLADAVDPFAAGPGRRAVHLQVLRGGAEELSIRADEPLPGGSMLKLPIAMAAYEQASRGLLELDATIALGEIPFGDELSVLASLDPDRRLSCRELCRLMLQVSDNAIAGHLVDRVGREAINAHLPGFGCRATRLAVRFPPGVPGRALRENVTSARDMVLMLQRVATEDRFSDLVPALRRGLHRQRIPLRISNDVPLLEKGGTLLGVANDAAIVFGERVQLALAVLTDGQADTAVAGQEIADLAGRVWAALGERVAW
jgi:beta-lactamase class A